MLATILSGLLRAATVKLQVHLLPGLERKAEAMCDTYDVACSEKKPENS